MYEPRTIEEAKRLIGTLRNREQKFFLQMCAAKARIYDFLMVGKPEPSHMELKHKVVYLEEQLNKAIKDRDEARKRLGERRLR